MFDCKSGFDQSEDKHNCHVYVISIMFITFPMFLLKQRTFISCYFSLCAINFVAFAWTSYLHVVQGCLCSHEITWCQANVMYSWFSCDLIIFFFKNKISLSSDILVLSDIILFRHFMFYNILARQEFFFL